MAGLISLNRVGPRGPQGPSGDAGSNLIGPSFSYNVDETLDQITYDDGSTNTFTYTDGKLSQSVLIIFGGATHTKTFNYTGDVLDSIDEVIT